MKDIAKIEARDKIELAKWEKEAARPKIGGYAVIMLVIMCLVRMIDEFASSSGNSVQTAIVNEFYVVGMGMTMEEGLSAFGLVNTATLFVAVFTLFFISLIDTYGRKKILIISVLGMSLGLFICYISTNIAMHVVGRCVLFFFTSTDIHQIYIMEVAPSDKRATYVTWTAAIGCVGTMLIAAARAAFTVNGELIWRNVYLVPALVGFLAVVLIIIFGRETNSFLKLRCEYLSKTYEQRQREAEEAKAQKKLDAKTTGVKAGFKYLFKDKTARRIFLITLPNGLAMFAFSYYYEAIMSQAGMSVGEVNQALFVYPLAMAVIAYFAGIFADKLGRRPSCTILAVLALLFLTLFIVSAERGWNPYLVGLFFGIALSSYYRFGDILGLTLNEVLPASIRGSTAVCRGVFSIVITTAGSVVVSILIGMFKTTTVCLVWGFTVQALTLILFLVFGKETKGVEM